MMIHKIKGLINSVVSNKIKTKFVDFSNLRIVKILILSFYYWIGFFPLKRNV